MAIRPAGKKISDFFGDKPDYGALGSQATSEAARDEVNTALNNVKTAATAMRAEANRAAGEHYADVTRSIGATQAGASLFVDSADAVGIVGGTAMKKWSPFNKPSGDLSPGLNIPINDYLEHGQELSTSELSPGLGIPFDDYLKYGS